MELKPCQRCLNNDACVYLDADDSDTFSYVRCECGATSPNFDTEELAIEWWNTRAADPLMKEMAEALELAISHAYQEDWDMGENGRVCLSSMEQVMQKHHEQEATNATKP